MLRSDDVRGGGSARVAVTQCHLVGPTRQESRLHLVQIFAPQKQFGGCRRSGWRGSSEDAPIASIWSC